MTTLVAALLGPAGFEVTCEECFERLDEFVEVVALGAAPERTVPGLAAHLEGCGACREEFESLLALIAPPPDLGRRSS